MTSRAVSEGEEMYQAAGCPVRLGGRRHGMHHLLPGCQVRKKLDGHLGERRVNRATQRGTQPGKRPPSRPALSSTVDYRVAVRQARRLVPAATGDSKSKWPFHP
jgi:hypothetical protein